MNLQQAQQYLKFADELADAAAACTLSYFRRPLSVQVKADASPVTLADSTTEKTLTELIAKRYPHHAVLGEEFGDSQADSPLKWVIDPIDGTRSFISGYPLYATLITLMDEGEPRVSVVDFPALKERYSAIRHPDCRWAKKNGEVICATAATVLSQTVACTTTIGIDRSARDAQLRLLLEQCGQVQLGGDSFAYMSLSAGFCHLVADHRMQPYDYLPLIPVIEGAGASVSDWDGAPLTPYLGGGGNTDAPPAQTVIATATPALHREALLRLSV